MARKVVSLAVGVVIASVLAFPAVAADGKGKGKELSACKQAVREAAKTFHVDQRKAWVEFVKSQAAARKAFRTAQPAPTAEQIKAFHADQRAKRKEFLKSQKDARVANRQTQRTALAACA